MIKTLLQKVARVLAWLLNLFDPPPLQSMSHAQKIGRIIFVTITLIVGSILVAMLGAVGVFGLERGWALGSIPEFLNGLCIIVIAVTVNIVCVFIILQIRKADRRLMNPPAKSGDVEGQPPA